MGLSLDKKRVVERDGQGGGNQMSTTWHLSRRRERGGLSFGKERQVVKT